MDSEEILRYYKLLALTKLAQSLDYIPCHICGTTGLPKNPDNLNCNLCQGKGWVKKDRTPQFYKKERFCDHCQKDTTHECKDSDHERDSSGDWQECLVCGWYKTGRSDEYFPGYKGKK